MRIAVIGSGPAGLVAAGSAKGAEVVVFEHNDKVGKKIYITGKGRCNFTNVCSVDEFLPNIIRNPMFARSALSRFSPEDAVDLLNSNGCKTKVERGRRAFPQSDKASDVTKALTRYAESNGAKIKLYGDVTDIFPDNCGFIVKYIGGSESFDRVILCTGGKSYSATGSDGSGYEIAARLGHKIVTPVPSLVALTTEEDLSAAQGLTLKNVAVSSRELDIPRIFGDVLITDSGISGPAILTVSAIAARKSSYGLCIDLKPGMTEGELDNRLLRDFGNMQNKQFKNVLDLLLPKSIISIIIERSGIPADKQVNSITKLDRAKLVSVIKTFSVTVAGNEGFDRAVVTCGGVDVKQVNPKTLESKLVKGLYFAGEVLDIDALTGGYNFHLAMATGYAAGTFAAQNNV